MGGGKIGNGLSFLIFPIFFSHEAGNLSPDISIDAYVWLTGLFEDHSFAVPWVSLAQNTQDICWRWRVFWFSCKLFSLQCRLIMSV